MNVKEFIDLHVHIGPEIFPRKFTVQTLIRKERGKINGMALKNHLYPTMPLINSVENDKEIVLIGSVTLNNYLGGLNPDAIYASAKISELPIIVWFPTINADNFLKQSRHEIPLEWVSKDFKSRLSKDVKGIKIVNDDGKLTGDTIKVLEAIKENDCILATGHVSWQEAEELVKTAVEMKIKRIIITHPIYQLIDMPVEVQRVLVKNPGVFVEQNYAMFLIDKIPIEKIAEQIKAIGADNCIISSDMGQISSPSPSDGMGEFVKLLLEQGISEEDIKTMGERNPKKLIERSS